MKYLIIFSILFSLPAQAQVRYGTVGITGYVAPASSISLWAVEPVGSSVIANLIEGGGPLSLIISLNDNIKTKYAGGIITLALRSNFDYQFSASWAMTINIKPEDVGFGLGNIRASGSHTASNAVSSAKITPKFNTNPFNNGLATIKDLENGATLMTGSRISNGGLLNSPDNALLVDLWFAILRSILAQQKTCTIEVMLSLAKP